MFVMPKQHGCYALLPYILLIFLAGCGKTPTGKKPTIPSITRVKEYVVELVTEGGKAIKDKAKTLADALQLAWRRLFPEWDGYIEIDPTDPLRGTLQGVYHLTVKSIREDGRKDSISIVLNDPLMRRETADSHDWEPDPLNYPPGIREIISEENVK